MSPTFYIFAGLARKKGSFRHEWLRKCDKLGCLASHSQSWCLTNYDDIFHNLRHHHHRFAAGKYHSLCGRTKHQIPAAIHQLVLHPLPGSFWSGNNLSGDAVWRGADHFIRALETWWDLSCAMYGRQNIWLLYPRPFLACWLWQFIDTDSYKSLSTSTRHHHWLLAGAPP